MVFNMYYSVMEKIFKINFLLEYSLVLNELLYSMEIKKK